MMTAAATCVAQTYGITAPTITLSTNVVVSHGTITGNAAGLTNLPVSGIDTTGTPHDAAVLRWDGVWVPSLVMDNRVFGHSMWWHVPNSGTTLAASPGATFGVDGGVAVVRTNTIGDVASASLVIWTNGSDSSARLRYGGNLAPRRDGWGGFLAIIGLNHTNDVRIGIGISPSGANHMPAPGASTTMRLFCLALIDGQWHWLSHTGSGPVSYEPLGIHASTNYGGNYQVAILRRPGTDTFDVWLNGRLVHSRTDFATLFQSSDVVSGHITYTPTAAGVNAGIRLYRTEIFEYATGFEP